MDQVIEFVAIVLHKYSLVTAFAVIGATVWFSYLVSRRITFGRIHGSAIAIFLGLAMAFYGGVHTGGKKGIADLVVANLQVFSGIGLMGGAMLRDLAIVATAFGVRMDEFRKTGLSGVVSLLVGVVLSFTIGAAVAYSFGYRDAKSMTTIPSTGSAAPRIRRNAGLLMSSESSGVDAAIAAGIVAGRCGG